MSPTIAFLQASGAGFIEVYPRLCGLLFYFWMMKKCAFQKVSLAKDVALVADLATQIWTEHYTPILAEGQVPYMLEKFQSESAIAAQIAQGHSYFLIFTANNAVGYFDFFPEKDGFFISKIYVQKEERGNGFATAALNFICERAKENNVKKLQLTVNKYNTVALKVYKNYGFKHVKSVVMDIGGGYVMDDFVLEKEL